LAEDLAEADSAAEAALEADLADRIITDPTDRISAVGTLDRAITEAEVALADFWE
jgi:hypothetical protein